MKVAVIGAGVTGLTIGFYLSKKGHKVVIFEKDDFVGGLASGFKAGDWHLERFYHHIFKSDQLIQELTSDLGLKDIWLWQDCGAPIFYQGKIHPFSSPLDLLKFSPFSFSNRLRTGLVSLYLQLSSSYHSFENKKGADWLKKWMGEQSWQVIWQPLLKKKFGDFYDQVSMSWIWARIHKRSRYLGYPRGGFQIIINKLVKEIKKRKGKIILNQEIKNLNQLKSFDKIIFTGASPLFLKIASQLPGKYQQKLGQIKYYGTVVVLLTLKKPLTNWAYWLNINDSDIPFVGCVQHSNLVNKKFYNSLHPVYLVSYVSRKSELFNQSPKTIVDQWTACLNKINKNFSLQWIKDYKVFKEPFTQPIFKVGDYKQVPDFQTPLKNVYLVNMAQVYPWDRGVNYAVGLGKKLANTREALLS